jgi:hypothetical protein
MASNHAASGHRPSQRPASLAEDPHPVRHGAMTVIGAMFFGVPVAAPGTPQADTHANAQRRVRD